MSTVTVGIPFLNGRRFLADAVRSVFAQTFTDWELILMDDGSTDGSVDLARRIDDPRVRVISDGSNRGLCARLNQITSLAQGRYLARMDADDLMHPDRLARQVEYLAAHPAVDLMDCAAVTIDEANRPLGIRADQELDCRFSSVLRSGLLVHPAVMGRVEWFRANPYDGAFVRAEDHELWTRTCRTSKFGRLTTPLFFYRESLAGNLKNYLASMKTVRKITREYGPSGLGRLGTTSLLLKSHLKGWAYRICTRLGFQDRLIKSRTRPLAAAEEEAAKSALGALLRTPLPGVDAGAAVG